MDEQVPTKEELTLWRLGRVEKAVDELDTKMDRLGTQMSQFYVRLLLVGAGFALTVAASAIALLIAGPR